MSVLTVTEVEAGPRKGLEIEIATKRGVAEAEAEVAAENAIAGRIRTKLALEQGQDRMRDDEKDRKAKTETQKMEG